jgi:NleD-like pathogen effector protein (putative zinc metallopeptidase)
VRAPRAILAALLALLALGFSPAFAQDAPSTTSIHGSNWVNEVPLDDIDPAPADEPEVFQADYGQGIVIEGDADYVQGMTELLDSMALLPSGQELLESLGETGFSTTITPLGDYSGPAARPVDPAAATFLVGADGEESPGPGSDALVFMDPDSTIARTTPEIVLGHELLHALHYHHGERLNERQTEGPNTGTKFEELRTIGTDGYDHEEISENELREEWNELYPDRPVAPERNGHRATDFGPSRTAGGGCCAEHPLSSTGARVPREVEPQKPREVKPLEPREVKPLELPEFKPLEFPEFKPLEPLEPLEVEPAAAEGAADVLERSLRSGQ